MTSLIAIGISWELGKFAGQRSPAAVGLQNKTSQTRLSRGTLVEQALPRKFVQGQSYLLGRALEMARMGYRRTLVLRGFCRFFGNLRTGYWRRKQAAADIALGSGVHKNFKTSFFKFRIVARAALISRRSG